LTVYFTRHVSGGTAPFTYFWNFGDGSTSTVNNPSHTYIKTGTYTARLTVTDSTGEQRSDTGIITVNGTSSYSVWITADPVSGQAPLTVYFTRHVSGGTAPFTYSWNFGDGATSTVNNPGHTYTKAGSYTVTLTVTDGTGAKRSGSITISVN